MNWKLLLISLHLIRLYRVDWGSETEWISAYSKRQAKKFWLQWAKEHGYEDCEWGPDLSLDWDRTQDLSKALGGDAEPGDTFLTVMLREPVPGFIATSCF